MSELFFLSPGSRVVIRTMSPGAAKATAETLMRYLAVELAPNGAPAIVETDAVRTLFGTEAAELVRAAASHNPSAAAYRV